MNTDRNNDPLHGVTLEQVVTKLQKHYEWEGLARHININCFKSNPLIKSSLSFLRKTAYDSSQFHGFAKSLLTFCYAPTFPAFMRRIQRGRKNRLP